jgi:hypothetical protein
MSKLGSSITKGFRQPRRRRVTLEHRNGVAGKPCTKCETWKPLELFARRKDGLGGRNSHCKKCKNDYKRNWDEVNREHNQEYHRKHKEKRNGQSSKWKEENAERHKTYQKEWRINNRDRRRLANHKRLAIKANLPDTLTIPQMKETLNHFGGCALTGSSEHQWDHVIPLCVGHGGTTKENMIPLKANLNLSKNGGNIFEWFKATRQRFELSQERFDHLIEWLASANAMSVEEYRDYVYWCHDNPRNIDDLKGAHTVLEPSN